jgi:hypothetical protein
MVTEHRLDRGWRSQRASADAEQVNAMKALLGIVVAVFLVIPAAAQVPDYPRDGHRDHRERNGYRDHRDHNRNGYRERRDHRRHRDGGDMIDRLLHEGR